MENELKKKFIREYIDKRPIYSEFCILVKNLLEGFLIEKGLKFRISYRSKEVDSLREKFDRKHEEGGKYRNLEDIEDLAGIRIVFYFESDRKNFTRLMLDNFRECIVSYEDKYDPKGYIGLHIVFKLDKKRSDLVEYKKYEGLKCEIQISTILYHAWSEIEHDIIYKPKGVNLDTLKKLGLDDLKKNFENIMAKHIRDATIQFDYIKDKYEEIARAELILSSDFVKDISSSNTNDEIYNKLELMGKFYHKSPEELMLIIKTVLQKKPLKPSVIHRFEDKILYGKSHKDIVLKCMDLLASPIKYYKPDDFLYIISSLATSKDKVIKNKALHIAEGFTKYDSEILTKTKIGYGVQKKSFDYISSHLLKDPIKNFDLIEVMARELLSSSVEGRTHGLNDSNQQTITMHFGAINPTDFIKKMRRDTVNLIFKLYQKIKDNEKRMRLVRTLEQVTRTPDTVQYGDNVRDMINEDAKYLLIIYRKVIFKKGKFIGNVSIVRDILRRITRFYRGDVLNNQKAVKLKEDILRDPFYSLFNQLVKDNYEESNENNSESTQAKVIEKIITEINNRNKKSWISHFNKIAKEIKLIEEWEFTNFKKLLIDLAKKKPNIATYILKDSVAKNSSLKNFSASLLLGLRESNIKVWDRYADKVINGKDLSLLNSILISLSTDDDTKNLRTKDIDLLSKIIKLNKVIHSQNKDRMAHTKSYIIRNLILLYKKNHRRIENLIIDLIKKDNDKNILPAYINSLSYPVYTGHIKLSEWKNENIDFILDILTELRALTHSEQVLVSGLMKQNFSKAMNIFEKRINKKLEVNKTEKETLYNNYDATPYHLNNDLQELIITNKNLLRVVSPWLKKMTYRTSVYNLELAQFFRSLGEGTLDSIIFMLIKVGDKLSFKRALSLMSLIGAPNLNICFEIIKKSDDKDIIKEIGGMMHNTGLVTGEYGLSEAYEKIAESIEKYPVTGTEKEKRRIENFKLKAIKDLKANAITERHRTDDELKMRKANFEE